MANTHILTQSIYTGGRTVVQQNSYSGGSQVNVADEAIADQESDKLVAFAVDVSQIKCLFMLSDEDLTVETNDGAAPDDTIALKADEPYIWHSDSLDTCLLTQDVEKLYVTNASGAVATLNIECVYDSTP